MPIQLLKGDLFQSGAQALVNTVNTVGVMGKGIALQFKMHFPEMFQWYVKECKAGRVQVGSMGIWRTVDPSWAAIGRSLYVINFPTKTHWRYPSKIEWISDGLDDLRKHLILLDIASIAVPALGCSNGGLSFGDVRPLIEAKLKDLDTEVLLFEPQ